MNEEISPDLIVAQRLSRELLLAAEAGRVEDMPSLDAERLSALCNFLAGRMALAPAERECMENIERLNEAAIAALSARGASLAQEVQALGIARRALGAYAAVRGRG